MQVLKRSILDGENYTCQGSLSIHGVICRGASVTVIGGGLHVFPPESATFAVGDGATVKTIPLDDDSKVLQDDKVDRRGKVSGSFCDKSFDRLPCCIEINGAVGNNVTLEAVTGNVHFTSAGNDLTVTSIGEVTGGGVGSNGKISGSDVHLGSCGNGTEIIAENSISVSDMEQGSLKAGRKVTAQHLGVGCKVEAPKIFAFSAHENAQLHGGVSVLDRSDPNALQMR